MITFSCPGCEQKFTVLDEYAGRRARCKACGTSVVVPGNDQSKAPQITQNLPLRTRRLMADARQMIDLFRDSATIQIRPTVGDPPEVYEIDYFLRSLAPANGEPTITEHHRVEIRLTSEYPKLAPHCRMLTPIFHPNIDETTICIGDHWTAGERLVDLVIRIGEMLAYQSYNIKSPLNAQAAMWADLHLEKLPIDARSFAPA